MDSLGGSRLPLDVMRVDTDDEMHRFSVCYATYGYMGDLLFVSEQLRWSRWVSNDQSACTHVPSLSFSEERSFDTAMWHWNALLPGSA
jgi:hypothetical protein